MRKGTEGGDMKEVREYIKGNEEDVKDAKKEGR